MRFPTTTPASRPTPRATLLAFAILAFAFSAFGTPSARADEYIICSGGPALLKWERYRPEQIRHDRWWGNFIRSARIRIQQLRREHGDSYPITWLVYRPGYVKRGSEDGRSLINLVHSVRDKYGVRLVWFDSKSEFLNYMNRGRDRRRDKISGFDYFGHSNKHCFMFDYSCDIIGASSAYLHENDLRRLNRGIFSKGARVQSFGCHTGESMSAYWQKATGVRMIGAVGKTDYSDIWKGTLPHINKGYWKR